MLENSRSLNPDIRVEVVSSLWVQCRILDLCYGIRFDRAGLALEEM